MKLIADTHTHTIASTHAYSTLQEMVHAAAEKKLFLQNSHVEAPCQGCHSGLTALFFHGKDVWRPVLFPIL